MSLRIGNPDSGVCFKPTAYSLQPTAFCYYRTMQHYKPEKVFVERAVADSIITRNVLENLPQAPFEWIDEAG